MAKTVTHNDQNQAFFGQEDHLKVSQERSFSQMIFELLSEKTPTPQELKIFELILNLSIDHGPDTPSALKVINEAKKGKSISEAVAEGIEEISDIHGGAIEPAMEILYRVKSPFDYPQGKQGSRVKDLVGEFLKEGKRMAGFGHRIYQSDPRAQLMLSKLQQENLGQEFINIALEIEKELAVQKNKKLPLNIDGAIAVALCSFGWSPKLGKAVFIIARTPGLCGQYLNSGKLNIDKRPIDR